MASRAFLKILKLARSGDASAQQKLASAYLTGEFKTPIQPANALIWLEKSFSSLTNKSTSNLSLSEIANPLFLAHLSSIPLAATINTPAFSFGWNSFWDLAQADTQFSSAAQWQLADLLLNPLNKDLQTELAQWTAHQECDTTFTEYLDSAKQYLSRLALSVTAYTAQAKTLLIQLQPKNDMRSALWNTWLTDANEDALIQAADLGLTIAQLTLGLKLAQFDHASLAPQNSGKKSNASLKKAAHWLGLAAKNGNRDAWFALGEIYRRPQFSGYNASQSDRYFENAADLGHPLAQLRMGAHLWRKREKLEEGVRGLQASYWVWQAHQQGLKEATELLSKILEKAPNPRKNHWFNLATLAQQAINHQTEHKIGDEWVLMCHRIIIANQFNLGKTELLLCDIRELQHEHCAVIDIRRELPKFLPRLIAIETTKQRQSLLAASKAFSETELEEGGNLRQRRYRLDRVSDWLKNFSHAVKTSNLK